MSAISAPDFKLPPRRGGGTGMPRPLARQVRRRAMAGFSHAKDGPGIGAGGVRTGLADLLAAAQVGH